MRQVNIVDLEPDDARIATAFAVLQQLRPHLDLATFLQVYRAGQPQGLTFTAVFEDDHCVAIAGWRFVNSTHTIKKLYVDDLVTDSDARSSGHGRALLAELESRARDAGCTTLELDSGVQRFEAHRFYLRERMHIASHHFVKHLG